MMPMETVVLNEPIPRSCQRIRKLLIADDHLIAAEGLARICFDLADMIELVVSGEQLLKRLRNASPDLVIAETALPIVSGLHAMTVARSEGYAVPFLFLTRHRNAAEAALAMRQGARGYLSKAADEAELTQAIATVLTGGRYVSASVLAAGACLSPAQFFGLSDMQVGILKQLGQGLRAKEIAYAKGLSTRTIEHHKCVMSRKLGVHGTIELVSKAKDIGVI